MKDPTPWSKAGATEFERELLEAAKRDRAPEALKLRMAEGLALPMAAANGASGAGASAPTAPTAHGSGAGGLLFSPPVLWGSLSAVILAGALGWQQLASAPEAKTPRAAAPAVSALAPPQEAAPVIEPAPQTTEPAAASEPQPALKASTARTPQAAPAVRLREELALLDSARSALAARDADRALKLLDQHATQYARGSLAPEADALRIDAYLQRGAASRAEKLSRRFLERYPSHPLAAHIATATK